MNILKRIYASVSSPSYYQTVLTSPGARAAGYYTKFALLASLVALVISFLLGSFSFLKEVGDLSFIDKVVDYYPRDLVLTWEQGTLSANVAEPYLLPLPADWDSESGDASLDVGVENGVTIDNLVVIDTKSEMTPDRFESYDTLAWLGKNRLMVYGENGTLQIIDYGSQTNFNLNRTQIEQWGGYLGSFLGYLRYLAFPMFYFVYLMYFVGKLIYLLIAALLIWLILYLKKVPGAGYGQAYKVGLYLLTLPILVEGVAGLFSDYLLPTGLFSVILLGSVLVMFPRHEQPVAATANQS